VATFWKREGKRGTTWTVLVRRGARRATKTFKTKAAGERWARAQETAIDERRFVAVDPKAGPIFADLVDDFLAHRARIRRAPGKTFANSLGRLKDQYGLEPVADLGVDFWRRYANARLASGVGGSTIASDLAYATSVLRHAAREGRYTVDAAAPGIVRLQMREDGVQVTSRERTRRITDDELSRLFAWIDANSDRTHVPMRNVVEFALATGMRRGEILALKWSDIAGRVATIRRKHPVDRERVEQVPLLKPNASWPRVDPLEILERQARGGSRVFPYEGDTLGWNFERACAGAGLEGVVFHSLRHECLSRLADRGFDPLRLALVGGHRDLRNVKRYARLDAARLANE
jgi:integrase